MTQSKLVLTDPKELVNEVDSNAALSVLERDDGNTLILDSINAQTEASTGVSSLLDGGGLDVSSLTSSIEKHTAAITDTAKQMQESGAFSDVAGDLDFSSIAEQCRIGNSEDLLGVLGNSFNSLAETGDLLSLDSARGILDGFGFDSLGIIAAVSPAVVGTCLSAFNLDELIPNISDDLLGPYAEQFNNAIDNFTNDWYWLDKERGIYNYELLSRISPWALNFLEFNPNYVEVVKLARSLYGHRNAN